jgi:tetratricopeptide (TPR) repeat protein
MVPFCVILKIILPLSNTHPGILILRKPFKFLSFIVDDYSNQEMARKNYNQAIEMYQKAAHINPNDSAIWSNLGWLYYKKLGDYQRAIEASKRGLEINRKSFKIRCNLAIALLLNKEYKKALSEYKNIIELLGSREYSESDYRDRAKELLQEYALNELYEVRKKTSDQLLLKINEIISELEEVKMEI